MIIETDDGDTINTHRRARDLETTAAAGIRLTQIRAAGEHIKRARDILRQAGAGRAADAAARAYKSTEGAERHAERLYMVGAVRALSSTT